MKNLINKIKSGLFFYEEVDTGWVIKLGSALDLLSAAKAVNEKGIKKTDCFSPFPIHGLEKMIGIDRSWLNFFTLICGLLGGISMFAFMTYVLVYNWPLLIGGKPHFSWPAFIPAVFEVSILVGGLSTVVAFIVLSKLYKPNRTPIISSVTSDSFAVWIGINLPKEEVQDIFKDLNVEITSVEEANKLVQNKD